MCSSVLCWRGYRIPPLMVKVALSGTRWICPYTDITAALASNEIFNSHEQKESLAKQTTNMPEISFAKIQILRVKRGIVSNNQLSLESWMAWPNNAVIEVLLEI